MSTRQTNLRLRVETLEKIDAIKALFFYRNASDVIDRAVDELFTKTKPDIASVAESDGADEPA